MLMLSPERLKNKIPNSRINLIRVTQNIKNHLGFLMIRVAYLKKFRLNFNHKLWQPIANISNLVCPKSDQHQFRLMLCFALIRYFIFLEISMFFSRRILLTEELLSSIPVLCAK